jgi:hypothetical protein
MKGKKTLFIFEKLAVAEVIIHLMAEINLGTAACVFRLSCI